MKRHLCLLPPLLLGLSFQAVATQAVMPTRKPGLWEVTVRADGGSDLRQQKVLQCTAAGVDRVTLMSIVPGQEHCHKTTVRKLKRQYDVRTECYVHDNRVDAQVTLAGDFNTSYEGVFDVKYAQPVRANPGRTRFEGRWLGVCQPGMQPGDMLLPNGAKVNVLRTHSSHEGHTH